MLASELAKYFFRKKWEGCQRAAACYGRAADPITHGRSCTSFLKTYFPQCLGYSGIYFPAATEMPHNYCDIKNNSLCRSCWSKTEPTRVEIDGLHIWRKLLDDGMCVGYPVDINKIAFSKKRQVFGSCPSKVALCLTTARLKGVEGHSSSNTDVSVEETPLEPQPRDTNHEAGGQSGGSRGLEDQGPKQEAWLDVCKWCPPHHLYRHYVSLFRLPGHRRDDHRHAVSERGLQGDDIHAIQRGVQRL